MPDSKPTETLPVKRVEPDPKITLFGTTDPLVLIEKASAIATALARIIDQRNLYTPIQGKNYVRVEGWTSLGGILGVFPIVVKTTELTKGGAIYGFEAHVEARTRGGEVIGSAVARCTRGENRWRTADDYAILSMASTRATSKALRLPLGWVMTLAGYEATPAEEMDIKDAPMDVPAAPVRSDRHALIAELQRAKRKGAPIEKAAAALGFPKGRELRDYPDADLDALLEKAKALDIADAQDARAEAPQDEPELNLPPTPVVTTKPTQAEMIAYLNKTVNKSATLIAMSDLRIDSATPLSRLAVPLLREVYEKVKADEVPF